MSSIIDWLWSSLFGPPPPAADARPAPPPTATFYSYRWYPGKRSKKMPSKLQSHAVDKIPPGIHIGLQSVDFNEGLVDYFGRQPDGEPPAPGAVFHSPENISPAVRQLYENLKSNPPADFSEVSDDHLRDLSGFLNYVRVCLRLIYKTPSGKQLLDALSADGATATVTIKPGTRNQTGGTEHGLADIVQVMSGCLTRPMTPEERKRVRDMVTSTYPGETPYADFARALKALPLQSLFTRVEDAPQSFLETRCTLDGKPIKAGTVRGWLKGQLSAVDQQLKEGQRNPGDGVIVEEAFVNAVITLLLARSAPGKGCSAGINFDVARRDINDPQSALFRPPAIGLAHELLHAYHYTRGTAAGAMLSHCTTTLAELQFVGLGPFESEDPSENQIREQWGNPGPTDVDPSNYWTAEDRRRPIYEPPDERETVAGLRERFCCI